MRNLLSRYYYANRTVCTVLEEMRKCFDTLNFAPVKGLIEEVQMLANRMESALSEKKDVEELHKERKKLLEEVRALDAEIEQKKAVKEALDKIVGPSA